MSYKEKEITDRLLGKPQMIGVLGPGRRLLLIDDFDVGNNDFRLDAGDHWYGRRPSLMAVRKEGDPALRNAAPVVPHDFTMPDFSGIVEHYRANPGCGCKFCYIINTNGGLRAMENKFDDSALQKKPEGGSGFKDDVLRQPAAETPLTVDDYGSTNVPRSPDSE